jgi:hypothetical protein
MLKADVAVALLLLGLAVVVTAEGWRLGIGWSTDGPMPGFFVFYLGLALGIACLALVVRALRNRDAAFYRKAFVGRDQFTSVAKVAVPAASMILLTYPAGLYVAGAVYLAVYMRWIGRHSWATTALLSLAIPAVTFFVFEIWFLVPMPKGPLEAMLGY